LSYAGATVAQTGPQNAPGGDPPGRVGRLAFLQGTVSFHDNEQSDWAPALVNTPVTSGDAIWTQPNARSEVSIAGTRVRLDSATQLDMLALDDSQTRMQLDQGRIDIKTFTYDTKQPYEIVTPRGTISLQHQGDYYVEAGSTQDPTRLGVRQGAAQIQAPNGQILAVRAGEVGELSGDGSAPQLHTIQAAPPPMPAYWADRDRQVVYDQPPQYLGAGVTGYEDLNAYGSWSNDPDYGQVWYARSVPNGWSPYSTGQWNYEQTYGWTWVDEQPWGFAPYHYGRWAQRNNRWFWVPPDRQQRAVYAPALVAFVGGTELGLAIGAQNRAPVGWFPLGPREAYVPPYSTNRDYYRRLNTSARVQQQVMDDRWQRAQRHEALAENNQQTALMNRRFATVVPAEDFARSRPVERVAIKVAPEKLATAPVAFMAAPPSPTASIRMQAQAPNQQPTNRPRPNEPNARPNGPANIATLQAIKPEPERQKAPGPQFVTRTPATTGAEPNKPGLPQLAPRHDGAPAPVQIQGERRPAPNQPGQPGQPNQPAQANAPAVTPPALPPVRDRNEQRPGQPPQPNTVQPQPHPGEAPRPPQANVTQPPRPGEPRKPPQAQAAPQPPHPAEAPKPPQAQNAPAAQAPHPAAEPPRPQQAEPPKPQPPRPPERQGQATPQPAPAQAHAPAPPPPPQPQHQAAPPAPPPVQAHAPAPPPPQPQHQAAPPAPPPQQAHAPAPPPPAPHPAPPPPQQAQAPHSAPAPAPAPPHPPQGPQKPEEKK
jgi:FecR protein